MLPLTTFLEHSWVWDSFPAVQVLHSPLPLLNPAASTLSCHLAFPKAEDRSLLLPYRQWSVFSNPLKTTPCLRFFPHLSCRQTKHQFLLLPWEQPWLCQSSAFRFTAPRDRQSGSCQQGGSVGSTWQKLHRELPTSPHLSISDKSSPTETARISH